MSVPWPPPPICEDCNAWMVPDHGLDEDMKHDGTLLYVCPDCCQAVDRQPTLNGGEPKCDFRCPPDFKPGKKQEVERP
jgi:hypothetical protein